MTQQHSERTNYTLKYFLYQLGRLKSCIIFATIFSFLLFPMIMVSQGSGTSISFGAATAVLAIISFLGIGAVSFIAPLTAMKHLYTKTTADNILSLPLTAGQRFIGDICAGFGAFAVPFAVSIPVTYIVREAVDASMDFSIVFLAFALLLMFAAFNTLLTICCGRLAEAILYPVALNLAIPLFTILGTFISYFNAYGLTAQNYSSSRLGDFGSFWQALDGFLGYVIAAASPFGSLFFAVLKPFPAPIIVALVMTAVFLAFSFILYKKRPAQRIGQPFVFKPVFAITATLVSLGAITTYVAVMLNLNENDLIPNLAAIAVIVFILMLIMELINYKRIKNILKFILKYVLTTVGGLALCFVLYKGEGFGVTAYIPADGDIEYISIDQYNTIFDGNSASVKGGSDSAKMITDLHRRKIEERPTSNDGYNGFIIICYYLKNGQTVERYYSTEPSGFWEELYSTEGYRLNELNSLSIYEKQEVAMVFGDISSPEEFKYAISLVNEHNCNIKYGFKSDMERPNELISALEADLSADAVYGRHADAAIGTLEIGLWNAEKAHIYGDSSKITIYESYVNTLAYLNNMFGTIPTAQQASDDSARSSMLHSIVRIAKSKNQWSEWETVLITEDEYKELLTCQVKHTKQNDSSYDYYLLLGVRSIFSPVEYFDYHNYQYNDDQLEKFIQAGLSDPKAVFSEETFGSVCDIDSFRSSNDSIFAIINEEKYNELDEMFKQRYVITPMQ